MKKTTFRTIVAIAFLSIATLSYAQSEKVVKMINDRGFWRPYTQWLENEGTIRAYLSDIHFFSIESLRGTLEAIREDSVKASEILATERSIVGNKKGRKRDILLSEHFDDVESAKSVFAAASETLRLQGMLSSAINEELSHRLPPEMPSGQLKHFSFTTSNGFAGTRLEIRLDKKSDRGTLLVKKENYNRYPSEEGAKEKTFEAVEVNDSVFTRVRDMIKEGHLFEIGVRYSPDYMITDASNWSLDMSFEGGSISSSGYATGPDHNDELRKITRYLAAVYDAIKP